MGEGMSTKDNEIAAAIRLAAKWLGTGDAASTMGALEFVGACIKEASETIAAPFDRIADKAEEFVDGVQVIGGGLGDIASAIEKLAEAQSREG